MTLQIESLELISLNDFVKMAKRVYPNSAIRDPKKGTKQDAIAAVVATLDYTEFVDSEMGFILIQFDLESAMIDDMDHARQLAKEANDVANWRKYLTGKQNTLQSEFVAKCLSEGITLNKPTVFCDSIGRTIWAYTASERESVGRIAYVNAENGKSIFTWITKHYNDCADNLSSFDRGFVGLMTKLGAYASKHDAKLPADFATFEKWVLVQANSIVS